jgi:hypothetical protein
MAITWDAERIGTLNDAELQNLHKNAVQRNDDIVIQLCSEEMLRRRPIQKTAQTGSASGTRKPRTTSRAKQFEIDMNARLSDLARELEQIYDFSEETAKKLSEGTKGFRVHRLLSKNGKDAKTYGLVQRGQLRVGVFIDYRIQNDIVHIAAALAKGDDEQPFIYLVDGPERLVGPKQDMYPELDLKPAKFFDSYEEAEALFRELVEQIVPKKNKSD